MAIEKLVLIKEAELTNNCPECFNQDLKLTFYQKHRFAKLYHRITNEVTHQIICNKCGSDIYPAKWTDDIERIFEYYQKMMQPEKSSLKPKPLFYLLVLIFIAIIGIGGYLFSTGLIQF